MSVPIRLVSPSDVSLRPFRLDRPTAAITIDVESDHNSRQYEALARLPELLALVRALEVPLTAFVEGQFFENRSEVPQRLLEAGADVQLHCYDHVGPGDGPDDLARGIEAYRRLLGRAPRGYRAHTYRLTRELLAALMAHGFEWDSSILPGLARGGNRGQGFGVRDCFTIDDRLMEFPLATWPVMSVPLIHSYRLMLGRPAEAMLRTLVGLPRLIVYDMHMADLVWCRSLATSPLPPHVKLLYRYMWGLNRGDSFESLRRFVRLLRARGYELVTLSELNARVGPSARGVEIG